MVEKSKKEFDEEFDGQEKKLIMHDQAKQMKRYQAQSKLDGKKYDLVQYEVEDKENESYQKEKENILQIMSLRHSNVIRYLALYIWEDEETNDETGDDCAIIVFIKQEATNSTGHSLEELFEKNIKFSQFQCFEKVNELYNALMYLKKEKQISHGNINPYTILIDPYNNWKLTDFHHCQKQDLQTRHKQVNLVGSKPTNYNSPLKSMAINNVVATQKFDIEKDDVWAIGVIISRCLTGQSDEEIKDLTKTEKLSKEKMCSLKGKITGTYFPDLLDDMLAYNEDLRYNLLKLGEKLQTGVVNF